MAKRKKETTQVEETEVVEKPVQLPEESEPEAETPTATFVKSLTNYLSDVRLFKLSPPYKQSIDIRHVLIVNKKAISGTSNFDIWSAAADGTPNLTRPIKTIKAKDFKNALEKLGYSLNG